MTAPTFIPDPAQQMAALAKANEHRYAQAEFKRALVAMAPTVARDRLADLLEAAEIPAEIAAAHIFQLLMACPRLGEVKARKVLRVVGVPEHKRLRDMTARQRGAVAVEVRRIHARVVSDA